MPASREMRVAHMPVDDSFESALLNRVVPNARNARSRRDYRANHSSAPLIADFGEYQNDSARRSGRQRDVIKTRAEQRYSFFVLWHDEKGIENLSARRSPFLPFAIIAKLILIIGASSTRARVPFIRFETRVGGRGKGGRRERGRWSEAREKNRKGEERC